jgi:hypothetical protein
MIKIMNNALVGDFPITKKSLRSKERLEEKMQRKSKLN